MKRGSLSVLQDTKRILPAMKNFYHLAKSMEQIPDAEFVRKKYSIFYYYENGKRFFKKTRFLI